MLRCVYCGRAGTGRFCGDCGRPLEVVEAPDYIVQSSSVVSMQVGAPLGPIRGHMDFPDVIIEIDSAGAQYEARINFERVPLPVRLSDISLWSDLLRLRLEKLAEGICCGGHASEATQDLEELAEFGHYVWSRLFCPNGPLNAAGLALYGQLNRRSQSVIQILSQDFAAPWDLLYDRDITAPVRLSGFWGFRHVISRRFCGGMPADRIDPTIVTDSPVIGLCVDDQLDSAVHEETPFFETLAERGAVVLRRMAPLDPDRKRESLSNLREFLGSALDIAHFACHGEVDETQDSCLRIARLFPVRSRDLIMHRVKLQNSPLVILNACDTGRASPLYTTGLVRTLMEAGARSVLATECALPDCFAAQFSRILYDRMLEGDSIGDALMEARLQFGLEGNPLGLLYGLHGYPAVRLASRSNTQ